MNNFITDKTRRGEIRRLVFVLILGLVHGVLYVFLVPPWQHYDEPNHFEYAWLVAANRSLPAPGQYDHGMRREVASSMVEHNFFNDMGFLPDLESQDKPAWIGSFPQLVNPPLYYMLGAVPLVLLRTGDVTLQLYAVRLVSLGLFLVTILAGWGVAAEITPPGHKLRLFLPLTLALLPGFADLMTSINSDVGAVAFVSLALWGSIRLIQRGINVLDLFLTAAAVAACYFIKEIALIAVPVFAIALLFALFRGKFRWLPWALMGVGMIAAVALIVKFDDAGVWYRSTSQKVPTRIINPSAVYGEYVLQVDASAEVTPLWTSPLFQPVPSLTRKPLGTKTYTLGAWIWADKPVRISTPIFGDGRQLFSETIEIGVEPAFYAFQIWLPDKSSTRAWVSLDPRSARKAADVTVYYDGLVLVEGPRPVGKEPVFDDASAQSGTWGGMSFDNLIRNGSAERPGFRVKTWADDLGARVLSGQGRPSMIVMALMDPDGSLWFYQASVDRLMRTFWGYFGWGHVPLLRSKTYLALAVITLAGLLGAAIWLVRLLLQKRWDLPWESMAVMGLLMGVLWMAAISRATVHIGVLQLYLPVARYAAPAIIPTTLTLSAGWLQIYDLVLGWSRKWIRQYELLRFGVYLVAFILFDIYAILSIYAYYG